MSPHTLDDPRRVDKPSPMAKPIEDPPAKPDSGPPSMSPTKETTRANTNMLYIKPVIRASDIVAARADLKEALSQAWSKGDTYQVTTKDGKAGPYKLTKQGANKIASICAITLAL